MLFMHSRHAHCRPVNVLQPIITFYAVVLLSRIIKIEQPYTKSQLFLNRYYIYKLNIVTLNYEEQIKMLFR